MKTIVVEDDMTFVVKGQPVHPDHPVVCDEGAEGTRFRIVYAYSLTLQHRIVDIALIIGPHAISIGSFVPDVVDRLFNLTQRRAKILQERCVYGV